MSELILGLLAIIGQGLFAGSETAFTRSNWIRIASYVKKTTLPRLMRMRAKSTLQLLQHKEQVLIVTLIFTNIFIVIASAIFSRFFIINFGPAYTTLAIIIVTVLSLIFGDFLPKTLAQAFPEYWAIVFSPLMEIFSIFLKIFSPHHKSEKTHFLSRQDFLYLLKQHNGPTALVTHQTAKALFDFARLTVNEIMIPKERIVGFKEDTTLRIIKNTIAKYRFSRYPVFKKNSDEIIGIIHIKDLLVIMQNREFKINTILRKPYIVLTETKAMSVLKAMQHQGEHLAIVENKNGETVGIISLEDLLEELVGEIRSEA